MTIRKIFKNLSFPSIIGLSIFLGLFFFLTGCSIEITTLNNSESRSRHDKPSCDIYVSDFQTLEKIYQREYSKYEFQPHEVIAEIGAGNLFFSLGNMCFVDSLTFYVQDLNLDCFSEKDIKKGKEHFAKLRGLGPLKGNIFVVKGDTNTSNLPQNTFDKVILRLVYHEFKNPEQNLKDIYEILKPDGILYVAENTEKKRNKMKKCGMHRTEENLIREIESANFTFDSIVYKAKNSKFKIYKFIKK